MGDSQRSSRYYTPILFDAFDPITQTPIFHLNMQVISLLKQGQVRIFVRAIYPYGLGDSEFDNTTLALKVGDELEITEVDKSGWCRARNTTTNMFGLIPGNYVGVTKVDILDGRLSRAKL